ncbi:MAG: hypothetical protein PF439_06805 [Helicobacteraceae bacterium]|jgi:hypothetical protein|nr:hypothetical protein [Helicobacteraceae bacterium]
MHQSYRYAIAYFLLFGTLLLASGAVLFFSKIGFSYEAVQSYYLGSKALFSTPKSSYGLLEVALPHIGSMGLFIMVTAHFLLFASKERKRQAVKPAIALFVVALLDIFSGFLIVEGWSFFIWVKLAAFALLQLLGFYLLWLLFSAIWQGVAVK